jgi:hypothetical protein
MTQKESRTFKHFEPGSSRIVQHSHKARVCHCTRTQPRHFEYFNDRSTRYTAHRYTQDNHLSQHLWWSAPLSLELCRWNSITIRPGVVAHSVSMVCKWPWLWNKSIGPKNQLSCGILKIIRNERFMDLEVDIRASLAPRTRYAPQRRAWIIIASDQYDTQCKRFLP